MTPVDRRDDLAEEARPFEQWLLDSAREDELPRDVSAAWARFGGSLGSASGLAANGNAGVLQASGGAWARVARSAALKCLVLGAFAGSALTLVWLNRTRHARTSEPTPVAHVAASVVPPVPVPTPTLGFAPVSASAVVALARSSSVTPHRDARPSVSNLGAQVALLDTARAALAAGSFAAALQATDRYARQFPTGELRPDAEVVAIEALASRGDEAACRERAARFLARYPADPHAARVTALAARAHEPPKK